MLCCAVCETKDSNELLTIAQVVWHVVAAVSVPKGSHELQVLRGEVHDLF